MLGFLDTLLDLSMKVVCLKLLKYQVPVDLFQCSEVFANSCMRDKLSEDNFIIMLQVLKSKRNDLPQSSLP